MCPHLRTLVDAGLCFLLDQDLLSSDCTQERVGLAGRGGSKPYQLSGGERRPADLAAVLVRQLRCLLADEPFHDVPPLFYALQTLRAEGCAIVMTGHDVPVLMEIAN